MTREEAIHDLLVVKQFFEEERGATPLGIVFAIRELKKPEFTEDCISRKAALDAMFSLCDAEETLVDNPYRDNPHIDAITDTLERLQPVTPARPKGEWITWKEAGNEIPSETRFECSVCHDAAQTLCNGLDLLSSYCPNCGAEMEVKE